VTPGRAAFRPALAGTLAAVAQALATDADGWWIIGSAAVALHGADAGDVHDVDLLVDRAIVGPLVRRLGLTPLTLPPHPLFRSAVFARWLGLPRPVEIMAGLAVAAGDGWQDVRLRSRQRVAIDGASLFVPEADELLRLLHLFGRPKDRVRAAALARQGWGQEGRAGLG